MKRFQIRGISTLTFVALVVAAVGAYAAWDSYKKEQQRAAHQAAFTTSIADMDKARSEWLDAMKVAGAAPRVALAGPVTGLQSIRQGVMRLTVPDCLKKNHQDLIRGMDAGIDGMLAFMQNEMPRYELEEFTGQKMRLMRDSFTQYDEKPVICQQKR